MRALIDADLILYRIGFSAQDVTEERFVYYRVDKFIQENIMERINPDEWTFFLTDGKSNFRNKLTAHLPENLQYKYGRPPRPIWYNEIKEYLLSEYDAIMCKGIEADDAVSIEQVEGTYHTYHEDQVHTQYTTVICGQDKDLLQIPGPHYNYITGDWSYVSYDEGMRWFYRQVLMGDNSDNVKGIHRLGPKKSAKLVENVPLDELWNVIVREYSTAGMSVDTALMNARLVWMMREVNAPLWTPDYKIPIGNIETT